MLTIFVFSAERTRNIGARFGEVTHVRCCPALGRRIQNTGPSTAASEIKTPP
jgi:hypothetical protein